MESPLEPRPRCGTSLIDIVELGLSQNSSPSFPDSIDGAADVLPATVSSPSPSVGGSVGVGTATPLKRIGSESCHGEMQFGEPDSPVTLTSPPITRPPVLEKNIWFFEDQYRAALCLMCQTIKHRARPTLLLANSWYRHLKENHCSDAIPSGTFQELVRAFSAAVGESPLADTFDEVRRQVPSNPQPFPHLPTEDGWRCLLCDFCTTNESWLKRHFSGEHSGKPSAAPRACRIQRLVHTGSGSKAFVVNSPIPINTTATYGEPQLSQDTLDAENLAALRSFAPLVGDPSAHRSGWNRASQFDVHLKEVNVEVLASHSARVRRQPAAGVSLRKNLRQLFDAWRESARLIGGDHSQRITRYHRGDVRGANDLYLDLQEESAKRYTDAMADCLTYFMPSATACHIPVNPMSPDEVTHYKELQGWLEREGLVDQQTILHRLQSLVMKLFLCPPAPTVFDFPIIHWMAVRTFNSESLGFYPAHRISPFFAPMVMWGRLAVIQRTIDEIPFYRRDISAPGNPHDPQHQAHYQQFVAKLERNCVDFSDHDQSGCRPLPKLRSLMHLAMLHGKQSQENAMRSVTVLEGGSVIQVDGNSYSMEEMRLVPLQPVQTAQAILLDDLLGGQDPSFLPTPEYMQQFKDDPHDEAFGHSFRTYPENRLSQLWQRTPDLLGEKMARDSLNRWQMASLKLYHHKVGEFLEALLVAIHLTAGQPARAKSILGTTFVNFNGVRSFRLFHGRFLFTTSFSKNDFRGNTAALIFRFLPHEVGRMLFLYLTHVQPLVDYHLREHGLPSTGPFLWSSAFRRAIGVARTADDRGFWREQRLTDAMRRHIKLRRVNMTEAASTLSISSWRQFAVEASRLFLGNIRSPWIDATYSGTTRLSAGVSMAGGVLEAEDDVIQEIADAQADHSTCVALLNYGGARHGDERIDRFMTASITWHRIFSRTWEIVNSCNGTICERATSPLRSPLAAAPTSEDGITHIGKGRSQMTFDKKESPPPPYRSDATSKSIDEGEDAEEAMWLNELRLEEARLQAEGIIGDDDAGLERDDGLVSLRNDAWKGPEKMAVYPGEPTRSPPVSAAVRDRTRRQPASTGQKRKRNGATPAAIEVIDLTAVDAVEGDSPTSPTLPASSRRCFHKHVLPSSRQGHGCGLPSDCWVNPAHPASNHPRLAKTTLAVLGRFYGLGAGYQAPEQGEAVDAVFACSGAGQRALIVLATGVGKSLLFQLSHERGNTARYTVVISFFTAILDGHVRSCQEKGIRCTRLTSGLLTSGRLRTGDLLICPGELAVTKPFRMWAGNAYDRGVLDRVFVDEAHVPLLVREKFRAELRDMSLLRQLRVPTILLTATAPPCEFGRFTNMYGPIHSEYRAHTQRGNLRILVSKMQLTAQEYLTDNTLTNGCDCAKVISWLVHLWGGCARGGRTIIFVRTRDVSEQIAKDLNDFFEQSNMVARADAWHSDRKRDGSDVLDRWMGADCPENRQIPIIVATCGLGTGLDVPNVRLVIHLEPQHDFFDFAQQIGRAGRDGKPAVVCSAYTDDGLRLFEAEYKRKARMDGDGLPDTLGPYLSFLTGGGCRRGAMSEYLDGKRLACVDLGPTAQRCDVCSTGGPIDDWIRNAAHQAGRSAPILPAMDESVGRTDIPAKDRNLLLAEWSSHPPSPPDEMSARRYHARQRQDGQPKIGAYEGFGGYKGPLVPVNASTVAADGSSLVALPPSTPLTAEMERQVANQLARQLASSCRNNEDSSGRAATRLPPTSHDHGLPSQHSHSSPWSVGSATRNHSGRHGQPGESGTLGSISLGQTCASSPIQTRSVAPPSSPWPSSLLQSGNGPLMPASNMPQLSLPHQGPLSDHAASPCHPSPVCGDGTPPSKTLPSVRPAPSTTRSHSGQPLTASSASSLHPPWAPARSCSGTPARPPSIAPTSAMATSTSTSSNSVPAAGPAPSSQVTFHAACMTYEEAETAMRLLEGVCLCCTFQTGQASSPGHTVEQCFRKNNIFGHYLTFRKPAKINSARICRRFCWRCLFPDLLCTRICQFPDVVLPLIYTAWFHHDDQYRVLLFDHFPNASRDVSVFVPWLVRSEPLSDPPNAWKVFLVLLREWSKK